MFFVSNLRSSFQAVGRGFDPRLPLHVFNGLQLVNKPDTAEYRISSPVGPGPTG